MATVRALNNVLFIDYRVGGKRKRVSTKLKDSRENRKKAEVIRKQIEYEVSIGLYSERLKRLDKKEMSLSRGFDEFLKSKDDLNKKTADGYRNAMEKFIKYSGNVAIKRITPELVKEIKSKLQSDKYKANITGTKNLQINSEKKVYKEKTLKEITIISYINKLRIIFNYFVKQKYIPDNPFPAQQIKFKPVVTIPDKELSDILSKLKRDNREHYKVIMFLLLTGLRVGELIGLTFEESIDFREEILKVKNFKKNREDLLPIYPELMEFIRDEWNEYTGLLFNYKSTHSMKFFERFRKREGYENYSFHTLRKTFITKLINSGMSVYDVMTLARHRNIETTLRHYSRADLRRMGNEISNKTNMGSILGSSFKKGLKLVKNA
jgi:integrase